MAMSQEQLRALLEISGSDIGGMEDEQAQQIALANALRGRMGDIRGMDVGSNFGRAGYGIGAAAQDYKAKQATPGIGEAKKSTFAKIIAGLSGKKKPEFGVTGVPFDEDVSHLQG